MEQKIQFSMSLDNCISTCGQRALWAGAGFPSFQKVLTDSVALSGSSLTHGVDVKGSVGPSSLCPAQCWVGQWPPASAWRRSKPVFGSDEHLYCIRSSARCFKDTMSAVPPPRKLMPKGSALTGKSARGLEKDYGVPWWSQPRR